MGVFSSTLRIHNGVLEWSHVGRDGSVKWSPAPKHRITHNAKTLNVGNFLFTIANAVTNSNAYPDAPTALLRYGVEVTLLSGEKFTIHRDGVTHDESCENRRKEELLLYKRKQERHRSRLQSLNIALLAAYHKNIASYAAGPGGLKALYKRLKITPEDLPFLPDFLKSQEAFRSEVRRHFRQKRHKAKAKPISINAFSDQ